MGFAGNFLAACIAGLLEQTSVILYGLCDLSTIIGLFAEAFEEAHAPVLGLVAAVELVAMLACVVLLVNNK